MMNKLANDIAVAVNYKLAGLADLLPKANTSRVWGGVYGSGLGALAGDFAGMGIGTTAGGLKGLYNVIKNRNDNSLLTQLKRGIGIEKSPSLMGDIGQILRSAGQGTQAGHRIGVNAGSTLGGLYGLYNPDALDRATDEFFRHL